METAQKGLYDKLNFLIDEELDKPSDIINAEMISECVDGILRLKKTESYLLTKFQREENIKKILKCCNKNTEKFKPMRILIAAIIIILILIVSVFAYTVVEYNIHDYDTYSEVWVNMLDIAKNIDSEVTAAYIPDNFVLVDSIEQKRYSSKSFTDGNAYITIEKYNSDKPTEINTEFGKSHSVMINGTEYIIYGEMAHGVGILWSKKGYMYSVGSTLSEDILLDVAQGVS